MKIMNIRDLLPLVDKKDEFIVMDKGDFTVIDYVYQDKDTFEYPELMECRGIKFDKEGLIIARPFRKFFNYGEQGSDLPIHRPHTITTKLDGSMIHPALLGRHLYFMTRKGHTDVAKKAERFVLSSKAQYAAFSRHMINNGWTPIFEYVGPDNRILLRYDESSLVLLAARHMVEGTIMSPVDLIDVAESYEIPLVSEPEGMEGDLIADVAKFVEHTRGLIDAEGYVIYFDDGYMVKIKAEDYVLKHRALDDFSSKKKVVALCAQGFMDDVLPILDDADRQELLDFNDAVQMEVARYSGAIQNIAQKVTHGEIARKDFFEAMQRMHMPRWMIGVAFGIMDGKDPRKMIIDMVVKDPSLIAAKWRGD